MILMVMMTETTNARTKKMMMMMMMRLKVMMLKKSRWWRRYQWWWRWWWWWRRSRLWCWKEKDENINDNYNGNDDDDAHLKVMMLKGSRAGGQCITFPSESYCSQLATIIVCAQHWLQRFYLIAFWIYLKLKLCWPLQNHHKYHLDIIPSQTQKTSEKQSHIGGVGLGAVLLRGKKNVHW